MMPQLMGKTGKAPFAATSSKVFQRGSIKCRRQNSWFGLWTRFLVLLKIKEAFENFFYTFFAFFFPEVQLSSMTEIRPKTRIGAGENP